MNDNKNNIENAFQEICPNKDKCQYSNDCVFGRITSSHPYIPLYVTQLIGEGYYYCCSKYNEY